MREFGFTAVGTWLYAALLALLPRWLEGLTAPWIVATLVAFLLGYSCCAVVDLYRCWRLANVDKVQPTKLELTIAALFLFPVGSLFWFPWDVARWINRRIHA